MILNENKEGGGEMDNQLEEAAIEQDGQSNTPSNHLLNFCGVIKKGHLTTSSSRGSSYFEWSISMNPLDIDGPEEENEPEINQSMEEDRKSDSSDEDSEGDKENTPDTIEDSGRTLDSLEHLNSLPTIPNVNLPEPQINLKGYEYTEFRPATNQDSPDIRIAPTQSEALAALQDLKKVLHPRRDTGRGYKDPEFDLWRRARLEGMFSMLNIFMNP